MKKRKYTRQERRGVTDVAACCMCTAAAAPLLGRCGDLRVARAAQVGSSWPPPDSGATNRVLSEAEERAHFAAWCVGAVGAEGRALSVGRSVWAGLQGSQRHAFWSGKR